jgi:hypothetical protein
MQCLEPCVERPFNRIDGINCRPKLGAKLLNRGFHRSLAGLPTVSNATHRFFRFAPESGHGRSVGFSPSRMRPNIFRLGELAGCIVGNWPTLQPLKNAGWIAAFVALCAAWSYEVMNGSQRSRSHAHTSVWICPILGNCGPAGTPGLGRW